MVRFNKNSDAGVVETGDLTGCVYLLVFCIFQFAGRLGQPELSCVQSSVLEAVQGMQAGPSCSAAPQPCWKLPEGIGAGVFLLL